MQVTLVQLDIAWENRAENFRRVRELLAKSPPPRGSVVVLPEMFATGFSLVPERVIEGPARESERFLAGVAKEHGVTVIGGVTVPTQGDARRGLNQAHVINPDGKQIATYSKMHPFTPGKETTCVDPGGAVVVTDIVGARVAPLVCYDLRFPEAFRAGVRRGAELFVVIANWPTQREHHWVTLLTARAIENQAHLVAVNRCGRDPSNEYPGRSLVIDPRGNIVADAGREPAVVHAKLDMDEQRRYRAQFASLADMRADLLPG